MNVLGEGFNPAVISQINVRQKALAAGFNNNLRFTDPRYINYFNSPTSFLKLMSSVSIANLEEINNPTVKSLGYKGSELSKNAILFGGVTSYGGNLKGGIPTSKPNVFNDNAYGWGGTEFGLRPMPGLISSTIKNESNGSLRTATINIKCWSKTQFDIIDTLYLRLGYYLLLEWGHTLYVKQDTEIITNITTLEKEFYTTTNTVDDIQSLIVQKRYDTYGNFDAFLGRVVNFNWTFEPDGSYNIIVIARSIGDVIESLKANVLTISPNLLPNSPILKSTTQQAPSNQFAFPGAVPVGTSKVAPPSAVDERNKSNIHARLYNFMDDVDQNGGIGNTSTITTYLSDNKLADFVKQNFQGADKQHYIRFGALLRMIQEDVIPDMFQGEKSNKLLKFNYDVTTNLVNFLDSQVSTDPSKIMIKRYINLGGNIIQIFPGTEEYIINKGSKDKTSYGQLMNVYFNTSYIFSQLESLFTTPGSKTILIDWLKQLGQAISLCLGGINNIVPFIDEDTNTVIWIDQNLLYQKNSILNEFKLSSTPGVFDLFGYNAASGSAGFIKEFGIKSELPPQFAQMISAAGAARQRVVGEDATALSRLNKGLSNILVDSMIDSYISKEKEFTPSLEEQYQSTVKDYVVFLQKMNSVGDLPEWNDSAFSSYTSVLNTFISYTQQLAYQKTGKATTSTGFIPINISLTMTGLSGMKIFQEFTVDTNYLPSNYDREMTFLIKGVSHTIQNNTWDTTIESLSLPKITTKPDSISTLVNVNNAITTDTKANIIPLSKAGVVQDIIDYASSVGITDKEQLTAILTVAQAETNLTPTAIENKTYSINRAKQVYADRLIGKTDVEIRNIFSTSESAYNFAYNGVNGNQLVGDGYRFRGRGLTQITGRANYKKLTSVLKDNGVNLDLVNNPDLAARIDTSVKILILGKIKGLFGTSLNPKTKYTTSPTSILATQNRGALKNQTIINDYGRALAAINNTKWIQDLLNKS
jgi:predicted chitinase